MRDKEKKRAQAAKYRAANREKIKAQDAEYRAANKERIKARKAAYRAANLEKARARDAAYRAANLETRRIREVARRAGVSFDVVPARVAFCPCCGRREHQIPQHTQRRQDVWELDHKIPGISGHQNLQWLCWECNRRKDDMTYADILPIVDHLKQIELELVFDGLD